MNAHSTNIHQPTDVRSDTPDGGHPASASRLRWIIAASILICGAALIFFSAADLSSPIRVTLGVFLATLVGWTVLDLPETPVALAGAIALVLTGVVGEDILYRSIGNDIIWLMLSAFVIAGILRSSGLVEELMVRLLRCCRSVNVLFLLLTSAIFATAFFIPSTSARAAILMPVFLEISTALARPAVTRGLALLFPSVILLSAGASLTGAGAHLVAADFIRKSGGEPIDFLTWAALAGPFSLASSIIACGLILRFFVPAEDRKAEIAFKRKRGDEKQFSQKRWPIAAVSLLAIALFSTTSLHGIDLPIIALAAALIMASKNVSGSSLKTAMKSVEWNLLLFLAGTLVIGEALLQTGAAHLAVEKAVPLAGAGLADRPVLVVCAAVLIAAFSHLAINSRTARATVLIPTLALPLSAFAVNPASLILAVTLASGFCQTLAVSAKPVTLFGGLDPAPFSHKDLLHLAALVVVPFLVLLVACAVLLWPLQGLPIRH
ncbi:MAG: SLC13 family permease [Shinella sp.]|nr:SLC13 family permease [Shinella sp.]